MAGTLKKGFDWYSLLKDPFARAAYTMFMISEVHPFLDGNGRIARVMMNAELSSKGLSKIIIRTIYRDDYMGALRKLTRQHDPDPYIRMLLRTFEFSSNIYGEDQQVMEKAGSNPMPFTNRKLQNALLDLTPKFNGKFSWKIISYWKIFPSYNKRHPASGKNSAGFC